MSAISSMIRIYVSSCARDYGLDGTRALHICSPTMIRVGANAGWQINCQAALGTRGLCDFLGRNSSVLELIWIPDLDYLTLWLKAMSSSLPQTALAFQRCRHCSRFC